MIVHDVLQRSDAWRALRCGRLTASRAGCLLKQLKRGGEPADRRDYRLQLCCERITGVPQEEGFVSQDMKRGAAREDDARRAYEALTGRLVRSVGFVSHDSLLVGCSPDGVIGDFRTLLEVKAPKAATHLEYVRGGVLPADYTGQVVQSLWLTGADACDFVSFHPSFPEPLQLFLVRVKRNDADIKAFELLARGFLAEVDREVAELTALAEAAA